MRRTAARGQEEAATIDARRPGGPARVRVVAFSALTLIAAAAGLWVYSHRAQTPSEAVPSLKVTPLTADEGVERNPAFSPDGGQVAYVASQTGRFDLYVQLVGAGQPLQLTSSPAREMSPVWSPDARFIAFLRDRDEAKGVYLISALGGAQRKARRRVWVAGIRCPAANARLVA